jgi:hypothetical protein
MSRDDFETEKKLFNPYIEIGMGGDPSPCDVVSINVSTFESASKRMLERRGNNQPEGTFYSVWGVVGRTVTGPGGAYLNIDEPPISRTLMGFILHEDLVKNLPVAAAGVLR